MKRRRQLLMAPVLIGLGACAMLQPVRRPADRDAELRLEQGLAALDAGNYGAAFEDLAWVSTMCSSRRAGVQALTALAALELDPRNSARRPPVGTELLGRVIRSPGAPEWVRPLAETSYLFALQLGAPAATIDTTVGEAGEAVPPRPVTAGREPVEGTPVEEMEREAVYGCGSVVAREDWTPPALPRLAGPSLAAVVGRLEVQRDSAAAQAQSLATELAATRARLQETERELERIRNTLKP